MSERESNVEVYRALLALRLEVDRSIANDMESKVDAAFNSYDAELDTLRAQRDAMREHLKAVLEITSSSLKQSKRWRKAMSALADYPTADPSDPCTCGDTGRCDYCVQRSVESAELMNDLIHER